MRCSATRSVSPMRPEALASMSSVTRREALAEPEEVGGERRDLLLRRGESRSLHHRRRRFVVSSVRSRTTRGDVGDPRFGGAERLREQGRQAVQPTLDRFGLLRQACGNRLERFAPFCRDPPASALVRLRELRVRRRSANCVCALRIAAPSRRCRGARRSRRRGASSPGRESIECDWPVSRAAAASASRSVLTCTVSVDSIARQAGPRVLPRTVCSS